MSLESLLMRELLRYAPEPTFRHAINCLEVTRIQNAAIRIAALKREEAIEINTRRRELDNMPPLNYRDFLVGETAIGIIPVPYRSDRYRWWVATAWNTKPHPNEPKTCAQRRNARTLIRRGCRYCVGVAIVGEPNPDNRSGKCAPNDSLDMCEGCRDDALGEFRDLYCAETLVINEHPHTRKRSEPRPFRDVFAYHGEVWWVDDPKIVGLYGGR